MRSEKLKDYMGCFSQEELHRQVEKKGADRGSWRALSTVPFTLVTTARQNLPLPALGKESLEVSDSAWSFFTGRWCLLVSDPYSYRLSL